MSRVTEKLKKRIAKGNLPLAYDLYNESDVNEVSTTITATGNLCWDRCGTLLIFEKGEDDVEMREIHLQATK
jgi:hypothetical protein